MFRAFNSNYTMCYFARFCILLTILFVVQVGAGKRRKRMKLLIVGGEEATPHEFPWIVSLQYEGGCGGSIVNENWIVTAAHCAQYSPRAYTIVAGEHDFKRRESSEQTVEVESIIVHEGYDRSNFKNDIALMKLNPPLEFNDKVQAATLAEPDFVAEGTMIVAGWGRLAWDESASDTLQKVDVPLISIKECRKMYSRYEVFDHNICAGYPQGGKDSCQGDSGGPLMCQDSESNLILCGIVSWGEECAAPNSPGVYVSIAAMHDWIIKHTKEE